MRIDRSTLRSWITQGAIIFGLWSAVVLAAAANCFLTDAVSGREEASFGASFAWAASTWYAWALLTPLVMWLAERLRPRRGGWLVPAATLVAAGLVVSGAKAAVVVAAIKGADLFTADGLSWLLFRRLPVNLAAFAAVVAASYLVSDLRTQRMRELASARLETQLATAELRALKMQLHPHFVLNALNTIAAMIHRDPDRAEEMVARMGELLRMALDSTEAHLVPVPAEISFLKKYLEIEKTRFGDQLDVRVEVAEGAEEAVVPSLVLQPFVENAIKHRRLRAGPATRVVVRVWPENGRLRLQVEDNGPGISPWGEMPRHGLGIANTRARLDALFGQEYTLEFSPVSPSGLVVDLSLPLLNTHGAVACSPSSAA